MMNPPSPWTERRPPRNVVSDEEFKALLASQAHDLLLLANGFLELTPEQWSQRQLYHLYQASTDLETYLDDFGAKENRKFFRCRELVAILRWSSSAMSGLVHLHGRIGSYAVADRCLVGDKVDPSVRQSALVLGDSIIRCLKTLRAFWLESGMVWPDGALRVESLGAGGPSFRLSRDMAEVRDQEAHGSDAAQIAGKYLYLAKAMQEIKPFASEDSQELRELMGKYCREEQCRRFEGRVHNLQSAYDSLVAGTKEEEDHPDLRQLRGAASIALHLFEAATALSHLYGRHRMDSHFDENGGLVLGEEELSKIVINTCSVMTYEVLNSGILAAERLLSIFTDVETIALEIPAGVVLHARPISLIVSIVNNHRTPVEAKVGGDSCSASSIMQLLVLAGSNPDCTEIQFTGDRKPLNDLRLLFAAKLGEDGFDQLPPELAYLVPTSS